MTLEKNTDPAEPRDGDNPAIQKLIASCSRNLDSLERLAECLLKRHREPENVLVVPFVGAGASSAAGLPNSALLQHRIYTEVVEVDGGTKREEGLRLALDEEARSLFPQDAKNGILRLSLFEFAAVLSRFAYARTRIRKAIQTAMAQASHRPLTYELLSHLAKHEFIDHFVSLNFDLLLDEALDDELPDRLCLVASPDEVPGPFLTRKAPVKCCYLFKPFGSLSNDHYRLDLDDVRHYGADSVWSFMLDAVFRTRTANAFPEVILILIGYAAGEPAFGRLMGELLDEPARQVTLFVIDPAPSLPPNLNALKEKKAKDESTFKNLNIIHIGLEGDTALEVACHILRDRYRKAYPNRVWVPVARHQIISALTHRAISEPMQRLKIELILQAIKSRGFFTIEGIAQVDRVRKYAAEGSMVITHMIQEGILTAQPWKGPSQALKHLRQDYSLKIGEPTIARTLSGMARRDLREQKEILDWNVERSGGNYIVGCRALDLEDFFLRRFEEISKAPEIEVSSDTNPATRWLFDKSISITSVSELTEVTAQMFSHAFADTPDRLWLYGLWTTGEWLFHSKGWAWLIGEYVLELIKNEQMEVFAVLARDPTGSSIRSERAEDIRKKLNQYSEERCRIAHLDWWRHNRTLTLLKWTKGERQKAEGIYMRRRLATPLVAPIHVIGKDCDILQDIFEHYRLKVQPV